MTIKIMLWGSESFESWPLGLGFGGGEYKINRNLKHPPCKNRKHALFIQLMVRILGGVCLARCLWLSKLILSCWILAGA